MANPDFQSPAVRERFAAYPEPLRSRLLELRNLIFCVASHTDGVGRLDESLKWNDPAYRPVRPKSGTTIRMNAHRGSDIRYGLYVSCQTDLVERYRTLYGDQLRLEGNRAILFSCDETLPVATTEHCIAMALTYFQR
jgi:hypothetical protein